MSIIRRRDNSIGLSVTYPLDSTGSELSSDSESCFQVFTKKKLSKHCSFEVDETIVTDSANVNFESSFKSEVNESKIFVTSRKRQRVLSSSEESPDSRSRSVSPEITYGGTPVVYKLCEIKGQLLIIKKPMNTTQVRVKKCSDRDIADALNSDSDDEVLFENLQKSGARIVGSLSKNSKNSESPKTSGRTTRQGSRKTYSESRENSSEDTRSKLMREREVSLKMKLRRSTEHSTYKIESNYENGERRCSRRSNMGTPKRCGADDCNEDHSVHKRTRGTTPKTPKKSEISENNETTSPIARRTRKNSAIIGDCETIFENNCLRERDNEFDNESDNVVRTPQKRVKKIDETPTSRSTRIRRSTRLVNYNYDGDSGEIRDKENKLENDDDEDDKSVGTPRRGRRRLAQTISKTPQKQIKNEMNEISTPKTTPRRRVIQKLAETKSKRTPRKLASRKIDEPVTPSTPGKKISRIGTPSMKNGCLTPSMTRRTANVGKPATILEEARSKLHVSAVPKSLPCREEEFNDIYQFLERKLLDNNGGCIYISGVPGTGKTATVNEVIRCLKKLVAKGEMDNFDYIEINGMKLSEPRQAYVQILRQINGQTATWEHAYQILEKRFTKSSAKRPMTLLLVDELDLLCNKRQDVVYNLLDWPTKTNAQLVVITIANTMDLPERVLMGRVTSRLGLTRLTFQPYNHKQLQEIVMARLKDSDAFKSEAIQLVARKVAAVSGDARRALDICRRATEIAELNDGKIVTMQDVNQALTEMIASAKVQAIKHCSDMEKIFLQAVCAEVMRTGVEETNFHNVYRQLESMCSFEGVKIPNVTQTLAICGRLGANRLLLCEHSRTDTQQRILLNVSSDDIHFAMQTIGIS